MTSTIAFTPAASCFAPTYTVAPLGNDTVENLTASRGYNPECMPFTPEPTGYPTVSAVNCLDGYELLVGDQSTNGATTYGTCCPSGMSLGAPSKQFCATVTGYNSVTVINATETTPVHANFLRAPPMVMSWRSEDLISRTMVITQPALVPSQTPALTTIVGTSSLSAPTQATSGVVLTDDFGNDTKHAIHHTVILAVSIAVGCLVFIAILFGIGALILARKRQQKKRARGQDTQDLPPAYEARNSQSSETLPGYVAGNRSEVRDEK